MKRNAVRIVCNPYTNQISYFFRNELGEWLIFSGSSPLSRKYYTSTTIEERHKEIVEKLDEIYNRKNKGLDIFFEGTLLNYDYLAGAVKEYLAGRDVICKSQTTKIAVVGKASVGKTSLIEGIAHNQGYKYEVVKRNAYTLYNDIDNHTEWFEINGIDLGRNNVEKAYSTIKDLVSQGLSTVIYCVSGATGRIENIEKDFIIKLDHMFSSITVLVAMTMCYEEDVQTTIDEIEKVTKHMEVFPTLAKEYKARERARGNFSVEPFGLKELCTFILEGKKLPRQYQKNLRDAKIYEKGDSISSKKAMKKAKKTSKMDKRSLQKNNQSVLDAGKFVNSAKSDDKMTDTEFTVKNIKSNDATSDADTERGLKKVAANDIAGVKTSKKNEVLPMADSEKIYPKDILKDVSSQSNSREELTNVSLYTKVAVVGKKAVGKTFLLEGLERLSGQSFRKESNRKYTIYEDKKNLIKWYEIKGIDLGKKNIEEAYLSIKALMSEGLSTVLYCISGGSGRIEDVEKNFIKNIMKEFPELSVIIVLTMCYKEDVQGIIEEIKRISTSVNVIPILAKEYKTKLKNPKTGNPVAIPPFGLDTVFECVNGEK